MRALLILLLTSILLGCHASLNEKTVIGEYAAAYSYSTDWLSIKNDGTYVHIYSFNDKEVVYSGRWAQETFQDEVFGITFKDFTFRNWDSTEKKSTVNNPALWHVEVTTNIYGDIKLCFGSEGFDCFVKRELQR